MGKKYTTMRYSQYKSSLTRYERMEEMPITPQDEEMFKAAAIRRQAKNAKRLENRQ